MGLGVSISARHIDGHNILKRGAYEAPASAPKEAAAAPPAEAPKETPSEAPKDAMPAGALPHQIVQSPEHVNEPKVAAGEQHASGDYPKYDYKPPVYTTVKYTTTTTTYTTTYTTTTPYTSKMTYGTFYTYKNFP